MCTVQAAVDYEKTMAPENYVCSLLSNVHTALPSSPNSHTVNGSYLYYHYGCDGFDDRGWGCGYRTLQTMCSWVQTELCQRLPSDSFAKVPSIPEIQKILVDMEDKPARFLGSREWIGSFEAALVIEKLYDVPSKIVHMNSGQQLSQHIETFENHFNKFGCLGMMGGDTDASSKGILGVSLLQDTSAPTSLLILDPHFWGKAVDKQMLIDKNWLKWQALEDFSSGSFYNVCLPQIFRE